MTSPSVALPEPFRSDVWDVRFAQPVGEHPAVVLSVNLLNTRLATVVVAVITGTEGPTGTHIRLDADAGLTRYGESWVNITDLHSIPRSRFRRFRGRLASVELERVSEQVRIYLGL
jgi:mRNA interferase MazF